MQLPISSTRANRGTNRAGHQAGSLLAREPLLLLAVLLAALYFGRSILIPIALAMTFAFLLTPLVARVERLRLGRAPAALAVLFSATAVLALIVWLVAGQLLTVVNGLPDHAANIRSKLASTHVPADSSLGHAVVSLEGLSREFSSNEDSKAAEQKQLATDASAHTRRAARHAAAAARAAAAPANAAPQAVYVVHAPATELAYLRELARPVLAPLGTALMVLVFTVYMLLKREDLRNRMLLLAGIGRLNLVSQALDDAGERISRYLIANVSVNAGIGIVFAGALYAIGVPYAALWGALLALLRTVPYVGVIIGGSLPTLYALIYFATWWEAGCTFALIALLEVLVSNFLEPWLYGTHTGISELALLVMAIVWTLLWGWPGLLLSTPLTVCLIVAGRTMPQMSFLHVLLGDDAELAPEARFYERMLALDQNEAQKIIDTFMVQPVDADPRNARELYDSIVLPALVLAETDRHKGALEDSRAALFMQGAAELISEQTHQSSPAEVPRLPLFDNAEAIIAEAIGRRICCPVVCIPASDQADEVAATMLAQLLEGLGHKTLLLPASALTAELLERLAAEPQTTLCISAVPPFAFTAAQSLYQKVRAALPQNRVLVGLWRSHVQPDLLRRRLAMVRPDDSVVLSLAHALEAVGGSAEPEPAADIYARATTQSAVPEH